ncbi:phage portal protein [Kribbella sp. NPDC056345]|uniref:phage portal protein n=1 Tax=Kribbella sp. NPDC056345 TaxID=3345789 RepID=UPI0035D95FDC
MGILARFAQALGRDPVTSFALETQAALAYAVDASSVPAQIFGLTGYGDPIAKAAPVVREIAIQVPAVKRARDLIAATIGQLPAEVLDSKKAVTRNPLLDQPERYRARVITMTLTVEDLLFYAKAWWQVIERDGAGWPTFVKRLNPLDVDDGTGWPLLPELRDYVYEPGKVYVNGKHVPDADLIRFDSPNEAFLYAGARAIRTSLRLDASAANYAEGAPPADYFEPREGADPISDDDVQALLDAWKAARLKRSTAYVPAALKYTVSGFDPQKLQLQEARQHAVVEIARASGIEPEALGVSTTSRTYFNAYDKRKEFTDFVLSPYVVAIEERLSMADVTRRGHVVKINLDAFLRSSAKERYEAYEIGLRVGAIDPDGEVRELEGKPPLPKAKPAPRPQDTPPDEPTDSDEGTPPVTNHRFDAPEVAVALEATPPGVTFKVNRETRTITGLAVPYGHTAESGGLTWSFSKGTLTYADAKRVKLLISHDWSRAVGYAASLEDTDDGLVASFKVARGPEGDFALQMAEDGVYDGLSIGVAAGGRFDVKDGVNHAVSAPLVEISLTPAPAYDSARVTSVAAEATHTKKESLVDNETKTEATEAPAVTASAEQAAAPVITVEAPKFDGLADAIGQAIAAHLPKPDEKPEVVKAAADEGVKAEPLPYRFDGLRASHDFSTDLFAFAREGDGEAGARVEKFMNVAFAASTPDVAALNPARPRPDLYVDNLDFGTPMSDAVRKGTLGDQTPFVLPKFGTATNLVAAHVEGTAPTPGGFTATSQTVTPGALSGKVEITREVIDAGGSPQVSGLIWNEMVRAYNEAVEERVATLLDAATPAQLATLAVADGNEVLANKILPGLAQLQFIRGGARMRDLFLEENLFMALAAAKYADGRNIFPILNPTNAQGRSEADWGSIQIGSYVGRPAWALGSGSQVNAESSYLLNSNDVSQWVSAPKRFSFDYRVEKVDLAVWGYEASAITRLAGVRELSYDPAP